MEQRFFPSLHPFGQLIFALLITMVSFFIISLISVVIGMFIFRIPLNEWVGLLDMNDPAELSLLKYLQISQALGIFVIPPLVIGFLAQRNPFSYLTLNRPVYDKPLIITILVLLTIVPLLNLLAIWNEGLNLPRFMQGIETWMANSEDQAARLTERFLAADNLGVYLINVLMVALIPAFGEEFLFRGVIQRIFTQWFRSPHIAILLASVIFSALHLQFYGFLPRFMLGMVFGYLFYWSNNLWYPIAAHFVNNFLPVTLMYVLHGRYSAEDLGSIGQGSEAWIWALPSLLLSMLLLYWFRKIYLANTEIQQPRNL